MKKLGLRAVREQQRRRGNREMILHAAEAVILRRGFSATSMDDIAREAQFSKATLYQYFKNKAELIFEILIHFLEDMDVALKAILAEEKSAKKKLVESVRLAFRFYAEKENISRVFMMDRSFMKLMQAFVLEEGKSASEVQRRFVYKIKAKRKAINDEVKAVLEEGIASGEFLPVRLDAAVTFLGAVIQGYFQEKLWSESKPDIAADVLHIENFILQGFENRDGLKKGGSQ